MKPSILLLGSFSVTVAMRLGWSSKSCKAFDCVGGQFPHDNDDIPEDEPSNSEAGFPALENVPQDVPTVAATESPPETTSGVLTTSAPLLTSSAAPSCSSPILSTRYIQGNQHCGFSPDLRGRPLTGTGVTSMTSTTSTTSVPPSTSTSTEMGGDGCAIIIVYIYITEVCNMMQALQKAPRPYLGPVRVGAGLYDRKMADDAVA
ncbi:hypothetical protein CFIMG_007673RA00001 [Ceratocystis fimbriata CBS 114723]|uniref:Uncharacterized protein n=1 Tax=Ceratocystis fimbriata CBS 114723 TaxID=1035309 RepID=A0A2C5WI85_9PEZI|nr:hypothetical protein CFIMG_007673RA00001 [Ceratocystis fimbriata CBS 114723]